MDKHTSSLFIMIKLDLIAEDVRADAAAFSNGQNLIFVTLRIFKV